MDPNNSTRIATTEAYLDGFNAVFNFQIAASASGLVASFFIKKFTMNQALSSHYTARHTSYAE
jgi:hypothetical protein